MIKDGGTLSPPSFILHKTISLTYEVYCPIPQIYGKPSAYTFSF